MALFSHFSASDLLILAHSSAIPLIAMKKGIEWWYFFMMVVDLQKEHVRIELRGKICDAYITAVFLTPVPKVLSRSIQPCILCVGNMNLKPVVWDLTCKFSLNILADPSHMLCLGFSTKFCLTNVYLSSWHMRLWSQFFCSTCIISKWCSFKQTCS